MSRLLGAAYGVFCMILLAPPLALMWAGRDVESGWVSLGRKDTDMCLLRHTKLFHDKTISLGWNVQRQNTERAEGFFRIYSISSHVIMKFLKVHFRWWPNVPQYLKNQFLINEERILAVTVAYFQDIIKEGKHVIDICMFLKPFHMLRLCSVKVTNINYNKFQQK